MASKQPRRRQSVRKTVRGANMASNQLCQRRTGESGQQNHRMSHNIILPSSSARSSRASRQIYTLNNGWEPAVETTLLNNNVDENKDDNNKRQQTTTTTTTTTTTKSDYSKSNSKKQNKK